MGRSPCCNDENLKKGPWTVEEDEKLTAYINKNGLGSWRSLPKLAGLNRCGKSCRLRWTNYLRPDIKRGKFSQEEEKLIINLHAVLGNKWSRIASHLPGRTDNEIKNFWNTHIRKKLLKMGVDPTTHKPRIDLNHLLLGLSHLIFNADDQFSSMINLETALKLQADAAQLAKTQLLQNLLKSILSPTKLPPYFPNLSHNYINNMTEPNWKLHNDPNCSSSNATTPLLQENYDEGEAMMNELWACFDQKDGAHQYLCNENGEENENPVSKLVSGADDQDYNNKNNNDNNNTDQMVSSSTQMPQLLSASSSPTYDMFQTTCDNLIMDDDDATYWNNILDDHDQYCNKLIN